MDSVEQLFRIGCGPSSSHTMGPGKACEQFLEVFPEASKILVTLYGSLALTGKGHLTDVVIERVCAAKDLTIQWLPEVFLPKHPNGMVIQGFNTQGDECGLWKVYSVGGGAIRKEGVIEPSIRPYPLTTMDAILHTIQEKSISFWEYVREHEGETIESYLAKVWQTMDKAISRGIEAEGRLPGPLGIRRKASSFYMKAQNSNSLVQMETYTFAYALAVSEENACGGTVVTAPTCGSCGVVPAVIKILQKTYQLSENKIIKALMTAGLFGTCIKKNASISGAEVGCQGEIGSACSMAAAAAAQLLGATPLQIEYAAEMGLEHHLGLTCDPVLGLVQIPCIERNAMAAVRAIDCAVFALNSDGDHRISFDEAVETMRQTGFDLTRKYKETSLGGLATSYNLSEEKFKKQ